MDVRVRICGLRNALSRFVSEKRGDFVVMLVEIGRGRQLSLGDADSLGDFFVVERDKLRNRLWVRFEYQLFLSTWLNQQIKIIKTELPYA